MQENDRPLTLPEALWLLIAAGTLFGGLRVLALATASFGLGRYVPQGVNLVWTAPLGVALLVLASGICIWILGTFVPALRRSSSVVFGAVWIAATSLALNVSGLYAVAAVVFGAGVASIAMRLARRSPRVTLKTARIIAAAGVSAIAFSFTTLVAAAPWIESWRNSKIAPPLSGAPNVLLIVLDTVRARSLGAYGNTKGTSPFLDEISKTGVRFAEAYSPAPWTTPSHASIMTGLWPTELGVDWNHTLDGRAPTVAEVLTKSGYLTAGFVGNPGKAGRNSGISRGFSHFEDYPVSFWNVLRGSRIGDRIASSAWLRKAMGYESQPDRKRTPRVAAEFLHWLDDQDERPFFAFLNFFDAHHPYESPPEVAARFGVTGAGSGDFKEPSHRVDPDDPMAATILGLYESAIAYQDDQLRRLFAELDRRSKLANTLVIITSDHGEEFGEHGVMRHGNSLYRAAVHVPLILSYPGRLQGGQVISTPVSLRSVAASLTYVIPGLGRGPFRGPSLFDVMADPATAEPVLSSVDGVPAQPEWCPVHYGPLYGILHRGYRYIVNGEGKEELYRLSDIDEKNNLASDSRSQPILNELQRELTRALSRSMTTLASAPQQHK